MGVTKIISHSRRVITEAVKHGWLPGARYTNLRDIRNFDTIGLLDIDWRNYSFERHLSAARSVKPIITVARDVLVAAELDAVIDEAIALGEHARQVIVVPKAPDLTIEDLRRVPEYFPFGYSVPSRYGETVVPLNWFERPVHLLGGSLMFNSSCQDVLMSYPSTATDSRSMRRSATTSTENDSDRTRPVAI